MPFKRDFYEVLDISCCATQHDIDTAYDDLLTKYRTAHDHKSLTELNEAYNILCNPKTRKIYDDENDHTGHKEAVNVPSTRVNDGELVEKDPPWVFSILCVIVIWNLFFKRPTMVLHGEGTVQVMQNNTKEDAAFAEFLRTSPTSFVCTLTSGTFTTGDSLDILREQKKIASCTIKNMCNKDVRAISTAFNGETIVLTPDKPVKVVQADTVCCQKEVASSTSSHYWLSSDDTSEEWGSSSNAHSFCCSKCSSRGK